LGAHVEKEDLKIRIIDAAMDEFNEVGIRFTMENVAKRIGISKKTIYKIFDNKEDMFFQAVNYGFAMVKESEKKIIEDENLDIATKIRNVMIVLPDRFKNIDFRQIYPIKDIYPSIFKRIVYRVNSEWEPTIQLMEQGIREKKIRDINIPVFQMMVESSITSFLSDRTLIDANISYEEALEYMIDILMKGIVINE
jgi:AcrR family transcriptional regulator